MRAACATTLETVPVGEPQENPDPSRRAGRGGGLLRLRPGALFQPGLRQAEPGAVQRAVRGAPGHRDAGLFRDLCRRHGLVAAGSRHHDAGRRRRLRPGAGHHRGLVRLHAGRDAGHAGGPVPAARQHRGAFRPAPGRRQQGRRARGGFLSVHAAPDPGDSVLRAQPGHGTDPDEDPDLFLGQPGRHARRHRGLCLRRYRTGQDRLPGVHPVAGTDRRLRAAWHFPAAGAPDRRPGPAAQGVRPLEGPAAGDVRPQPGRHRRRRRRTGRLLHRGGGQGQGHAGRGAQDGRRLPELRLRA